MCGSFDNTDVVRCQL